MKIATTLPVTAALALLAAAAVAQDMEPSVTASDQSMANGIVSAESVTAGENGWLVVHRTEDGTTPGPVVGHAPIRAGTTGDVAAILTEEIASGDQLMLMVHAEAGGAETGIFEYTLGASEDGPVRVNDALVMTTVTAE